MRKKCVTEHQIIKVLKQVEGGRSAADVCREYGISQATYYNWKAKYGGMASSDIKRLKELEAEKARGGRLCPKCLQLEYLCWLQDSRLKSHRIQISNESKSGHSGY